MTRKKRDLRLRGKEMSIETDGRILFSFATDRSGEVWADFSLRESITLPEGEVYVEESRFSPSRFLERSWGTVVANVDVPAVKEAILAAGGTLTSEAGYCFPLDVKSISVTKASKNLALWLDGEFSTRPTLDDMFWGEDMPRCSKTERDAYFVHLDELRREARGGKGVTTPSNKGEDRLPLEGGLDAILMRRGNESIPGKIFIQEEIALIESAAYGVAARLINTSDIPSDGVIDLEKIHSLRIVHAGKNLDFIASFKG